jgi:RNA polymerase sigma-70 factor (ECF subfamily)
LDVRAKLLGSLAAAVGARGQAWDPSTEQAVGRHLVVAWDGARTRWPGVELTPERFARALGERVSVRQGLLDGLQRLRSADVFLACACLEHQPAALSAFEAECLGDLEPVLKTLRGPSTLVEDVQQRLRAELLVGDGKLAEYGGLGELKRWVRAVALRAGLRILREARRGVPFEQDVVDALPLHPSDPELDYVKSVYRSEFKGALSEGLGALDAEDRALLRQYYFEGLSLSQLGTLHRLHFTSVSSRLAKARARVLAHVRRRLMAKLGLGRKELDSLMRVIRSRLEISGSSLFDSAP